MRKFLRWCWPHRPHHIHSSAGPGHLCLTHIRLKGNRHMATTVSGTYTFPTTRKSGSSLSLSDINYASLTRNGEEIARLAPSGASVNWTDSSPLTGSDVYEAITITNDGFQGDPSNDVSIVIAAADPASAGQLTANLDTSSSSTSALSK
jgi:hypothetical protein